MARDVCVFWIVKWEETGGPGKKPTWSSKVSVPYLLTYPHGIVPEH